MWCHFCLNIHELLTVFFTYFPYCIFHVCWLTLAVLSLVVAKAVAELGVSGILWVLFKKEIENIFEFNFNFSYFLFLEFQSIISFSTNSWTLNLDYTKVFIGVQSRIVFIACWALKFTILCLRHSTVREHKEVNNLRAFFFFYVIRLWGNILLL